MLFYVTRIDEDHNGTQGIYVRQFVGYLLLFIQHASPMLQGLGYSGPLQIEMALDSQRSVQWLDIAQGGNWYSARSGSELDDNVRFSVSTTREELSDAPDGVVMELLRYVFFSGNWSDLANTPEKLERLVRAGHQFNRC